MDTPSKFDSDSLDCPVELRRIRNAGGHVEYGRVNGMQSLTVIFGRMC